MGSYEIEWKYSAERELKGIDRQHLPRILGAVESLVEDPFPMQHRKLHGAESNYRIRIGDCRVIYQVDPERKLVTVYHVRHRRETYHK